MRQDLTQLVIISDRSGSMSSSQEESQNAINHLIDEQKKEEGECQLTFVEFDDSYGVVYDAGIKDAPQYFLMPRGMTALYDAVGRTINMVGEKLRNLPEADRPALVQVVISTDGLDNRSREFSKSRVAQMIKRQRDEFSWQFVFIGVEIDAESIAVDLNININNAVKIKRSKSRDAYAATSNKMALGRRAVSAGLNAVDAEQLLAYSKVEKEELDSD